MFFPCSRLSGPKKSADEIEFAYKAADMQDKVMGYLTAMALPGVREYEVRSKAMQLISRLGGEEMIVLIGSAPPTGRNLPPPALLLPEPHPAKGRRAVCAPLRGGPRRASSAPWAE